MDTTRNSRATIITCLADCSVDARWQKTRMKKPRKRASKLRDEWGGGSVPALHPILPRLVASSLAYFAIARQLNHQLSRLQLSGRLTVTFEQVSARQSIEAYRLQLSSILVLVDPAAFLMTTNSQWVLEKLRRRYRCWLFLIDNEWLCISIAFQIYRFLLSEYSWATPGVDAKIMDWDVRISKHYGTTCMWLENNRTF